MTNEEILTNFMQQHYNDALLTATLAHAEDGKLSLMSCCCFAGIVTATHALKEANLDACTDDEREHWHTAYVEGGGQASLAFNLLGDTDAERRRAIMPLIRAELARREALREADGEVVAEVICV